VHLTDLALSDFRSHHKLVLRLSDGATSFVGPNGAGKTNIIEAVGYLATLGSHRVASDAPLVRHKAERAIIKAKVVRLDRSVQIDLEIKSSGGRRAWLGRAPVRRLSDVLGLVQAIVFAPEDLVLVKGGPEARRSFLDQVLVQRRPGLAGTIQDFDKTMRQRGALLKSLAQLTAAARPNALDALEVWNDKAANLGGIIMVQRAAVASELNQILARTYPAFAPAGDQAEATYQPSIPMTGLVEADQVAAGLKAAMTTLQAKEIARGVNLVGPQRDELALAINGHPARGYASHGESWSMALALRLSAFELLKNLGHGDPILILDDVFAELDSTRRARLANIASSVEQVLVTTAVSGDIPPELGGERIEVAAAKVGQDE